MPSGMSGLRPYRLRGRLYAASSARNARAAAAPAVRVPAGGGGDGGHHGGVDLAVGGDQCVDRLERGPASSASGMRSTVARIFPRVRAVVSTGSPTLVNPSSSS